jgi:glycosyltransferase involved in cell wall biosynthesis
VRILAVTPYHAPDGGGLERYAQGMLGELARGGHEVFAWASGPAGVEERGGVVCYSDPPHGRLGNAPVRLGLSSRLRALIQRHKIDVVWGHAPVPFPAEAASAAAARARIPFVLTYHAGRLRGSNVLLDGLATVARHTTQPLLFERSTRLIAVSRFVRDHALEGHAARTSIIPPGVDVQRFRPGRRWEEAEVLFVGPLDSAYRWKGLDVLLEAMRILHAQNHDAALRLVGAGDRMLELQQRARTDSWLRVAGRLPVDELVHAYQKATVVVLPSVTDAEAFGMVLAEANACGRPVVGSRIGGIPDFIEHGKNGLLVTPGDPHQLADALASLLDDARLARRLGRAGRRRVVAQHRWPKLAREAHGVLEQAVSHYVGPEATR